MRPVTPTFSVLFAICMVRSIFWNKKISFVWNFFLLQWVSLIVCKETYMYTICNCTHSYPSEFHFVLVYLSLCNTILGENWVMFNGFTLWFSFTQILVMILYWTNTCCKNEPSHFILFLKKNQCFVFNWFFLFKCTWEKVLLWCPKYMYLRTCYPYLLILPFKIEKLCSCDMLCSSLVSIENGFHWNRNICFLRFIQI